MIWWYIIHGLNVVSYNVVKKSYITQDVHWDFSNMIENRLILGQRIHFQIFKGEEIDILSNVDRNIVMQIHNVVRRKPCRGHFRQAFPWYVLFDVAQEVMLKDCLQSTSSPIKKLHRRSNSYFPITSIPLILLQTHQINQWHINSIPLVDFPYLIRQSL